MVNGLEEIVEQAADSVDVLLREEYKADFVRPFIKLVVLCVVREILKEHRIVRIDNNQGRKTAPQVDQALSPQGDQAGLQDDGDR